MERVGEKHFTVSGGYIAQKRKREVSILFCRSKIFVPLQDTRFIHALQEKYSLWFVDGVSGYVGMVGGLNVGSMIN